MVAILKIEQEVSKALFYIDQPEKYDNVERTPLISIKAHCLLHSKPTMPVAIRLFTKNVATSNTKSSCFPVEELRRFIAIRKSENHAKNYYK